MRKMKGGASHETKLRELNPEPGGDGALRRPRRVQRRNDAAR